METSPEQIKKAVQFHIKLACVIAGMTIATVFISVGVNLPKPFNVITALVIALGQASVVGYFLMHLQSETGLIRRTLVLTAVFLLAMLLLSILALKDTIPSIL